MKTRYHIKNKTQFYAIKKHRKKNVIRFVILACIDMCITYIFESSYWIDAFCLFFTSRIEFNAWKKSTFHFNQISNRTRTFLINFFCIEIVCADECNWENIKINVELICSSWFLVKAIQISIKSWFQIYCTIVIW